jgi:hypothetical protein
MTRLPPLALPVLPLLLHPGHLPLVHSPRKENDLVSAFIMTFDLHFRHKKNMLRCVTFHQKPTIFQQLGWGGL